MMGYKEQATNITQSCNPYAMQFWRTTTNSNIEKVKKIQDRIIVIAQWYVPNYVTRGDLGLMNVKEVIKKCKF